MKRNFLFFVALSMFAFANGNVNVEVPLYITDTNGVTDTLKLVLNENASQSIDSQLGEVAIVESELQTELSGEHFALVKIAQKENAQYGDAYLWGHKAIVDDAHGAQNTFIIAIAEERFPVQVSWNPQILVETLPESFITDWVPSGWFDACFGYETKKQMATENEITFAFQMDNFEYIANIDQRLGLFYVSLTDYKDTDAIPSVNSVSSFSKLVKDGQVLIQRGDKMYDLRGQEVKL